jgi:hypothetical protein
MQEAIVSQRESGEETVGELFEELKRVARGG